MKITLYVRPGDNPSDIAQRAKEIIESATGSMCNVRLVSRGGATHAVGQATEESALGHK
jgi:hypothetical protein